MAKLELFGGEKGGVGKSFVCRTAVQYHLDRAIEFALFDADRSNPDVKRIYSSLGCREAIFSENEKHEDKAKSIYLTAIKKQTLVNLPAQIINPFQDWFEKNELFALAPEDGVEFVLWFVCSGGYDSLMLLKQYFKYFRGQVSYVLVKNWGICDDWESLDTNEYLQSQIQEYGVRVIDFPKFIGNRTRNIIDEKNLTFGAARENREFDSIDRQRVKSFLKKAYLAFDDAGVFQIASVNKPIPQHLENNGLVNVTESS
ncbi:hypothetical protein [Myxosarcina sp. GI1]|uniref:hypothetical protein n=1 Tax=Myxosarcina sp. GI1 TaxID=1541065 RepID=UPI00090786B0|nr:hypothetical protein [Myxosarcina sp. GI1]